MADLQAITPGGIVNKSFQPAAKTFKTRSFARLAIKAGLGDRELCKAAAELEQGKGDDLGGSVWKKRVMDNRGRAIVVAKSGAFWLFAYLYAKSDRENIRHDELAGFRGLAAALGVGGLQGIARLVSEGSVREICNDCKSAESANA
ncbi:type II toxin-antitoxin system RelE/ParE family toxin [Ramlibacter humi]|uniref:Type II toxin-antitoxin system RelE/ParE family toxin n=1 Tax=Ramlibacter humi TaxID=2530451 RepID=A0A4Z0BLD9_9BURK|nr:type II toxin-antitoxin system RelE/ParE family toxin [Ramlibacter humi]TFZ00147.1 type II toxin-antitoxin system RelE/ParE family toxin [Ramlibacter humi]